MPHVTNQSLMSPAEYLDRRNAYSYPAVGLDGSLEKHIERRFDTHRAMEDHHRWLLQSTGDEKVALGYLSVIYWGHYSGQDGVSRSARALGKVRLAWEGTDRIVHGKAQRMRGAKDSGVKHMAAIVRDAVNLVDNGEYGEALKMLSGLPQLNFAFASKVCAFLRPEKCGVVDSIIAKKHPRFGFQVDRKGFVRRNNDNATQYAAYCVFLQDEAYRLNTAGNGLAWRDIDGQMWSWRAVDVERALY